MNNYDDTPQRFTRHDLERRRQEREYMLAKYRKYIDDNNPPLLNDLQEHMKPLIDWGYANIPELLSIVNAKIHPMKVINIHEGTFVYTANIFDGLKLIDTRDNPIPQKPTSSSLPKIVVKCGSYAIHDDDSISWGGRLLPLEPKQVRLLGVLLKSKITVKFDELFDAYWLEADVKDEQFLDRATKAQKQQAITDCISKIRKIIKAVSQTNDNPIKSAPTIGYRFIG